LLEVIRQRVLVRPVADLQSTKSWVVVA
jgi:hypothetical protein